MKYRGDYIKMGASISRWHWNSGDNDYGSGGYVEPKPPQPQVKRYWKCRGFDICDGLYEQCDEDIEYPHKFCPTHKCAKDECGNLAMPNNYGDGYCYYHESDVNKAYFAKVIDEVYYLYAPSVCETNGCRARVDVGHKYCDKHECSKCLEQYDCPQHRCVHYYSCKGMKHEIGGEELDYCADCIRRGE